MLKDILVHLDHTPRSPARLEAALALAAAHQAQVTAVCLVQEPFLRAMVGVHMPTDLVREHLVGAEREAETILATAREEAARRQVQFIGRRETGSIDRVPNLLARDARNTDIVVVGQPSEEATGVDETIVVEAAFMDSGRPALMIPHAGAPNLPPRRVLIAWDGSREAARAAHDALPLLRGAEETIVLIVDARDLGARIGQQPGADVSAHLTRHGARVRVKSVRSGGTSIGELIHSQAREESADLLVMGGYGHSRLREMLIGGATRYMIEHTTVPVLFAH